MLNNTQRLTGNSGNTSIRQRSSLESTLTEGTTLGNVLAGMRANWDEDLEKLMPWAKSPNRADREAARRQALEAHVPNQAAQAGRPTSKADDKKKGKDRDGDNLSALAESDSLPFLGQVGSRGSGGEEGGQGGGRDDQDGQYGIGGSRSVAGSTGSLRPGFAGNGLTFADDYSPERAQAALAQAAYRPPEIPREAFGQPGIFAIPNQFGSSGGYGSTWSHVARAVATVEEDF